MTKSVVRVAVVIFIANTNCFDPTTNLANIFFFFFKLYEKKLIFLGFYCVFNVATVQWKSDLGITFKAPLYLL